MGMQKSCPGSKEGDDSHYDQNRKSERHQSTHNHQNEADRQQHDG